MHIEYVEIQNFRKLKSIRIDFAEQTTVFVGANNSGKTSAMVALGHFLVDHSRFTVNDFTLSNWKEINSLGSAWESWTADQEMPKVSGLVKFLPSMDIWLKIKENEIHHVSHLIPTLDWAGGLLGVRVRLEPKKVDDLFKDYLIARKAAIETLEAASKGKTQKYSLSLWPNNLGEFLVRKLTTYFVVKSYILDPAKVVAPKMGVAQPQTLEEEADHIKGNPFKNLIQIDEISAQRGFSDASLQSSSDSSGDLAEKGSKRRLSDQLRSYYAKHIDPSERPEPSDVDALEAIHTAQSSFDDKLKNSFSLALAELGGLSYPGVNDLELIISTKILPMDGLNHPSALQYKVTSHDGDGGTNYPTLPEQYNGLGYQNLISMVFRLMGFRDKWMKVGKSSLRSGDAGQEDFIPPLHLVLVEEPEAHLHVQVQQVFIKKAYKILRKHKDLGDKKNLTTQLIVTTHSSHIAHECDFSWLRYFRRRPAVINGEVPTSTVINLTEVFGNSNETQKFVTRYLKSTHCDLFFADAAILVEGPAERMLVPQFIREGYEELHYSYITILEISGSHAHRLAPLIEHLGLITLIITDIDAAKVNDSKKLIANPPKRSDGMVTNNSTLRSWLPKEKHIDKLLDLTEQEKIKKIDDFSSLRVAYQKPITIESLNGAAGATEEALPNTFEDALVFDNLVTFPKLKGKVGMLKKFKTAISGKPTAEALEKEMFDVLEKGDKAQFALDMLYQEANLIKAPNYISEGLSWLEEQLKKKRLEVLVSEKIKEIEKAEVE